jgi:TorA maturation chaperone TorD
MRDEGLAQAIGAAGGVGALARALGISQPSVSNWSRVPAERVLAVEATTGVPRERLRPDLYQQELRSLDDRAAASAQPDDVEQARAREYLLLAALLRSAPSQELLGALAGLKGDSSPLGMAHISLADAAARTTPEAAGQEYFALFIGLGRGELLPYASYYLTGFLHERPLARLREDLARLGIERAEGNFDPEDHLGLLFEVMAGLADGIFPGGVEAQRKFYDRHIADWAPRVFDDLGAAPSARFYRAVAAVGRAFLAVETAAFAIED